MPRKYIRKLGARTYQNYSPQTLEEAVDGCLKKQITIRAAAENYRIPIGTLVNHMKAKRQIPEGLSVHKEKPGRPTVFSPEEEDILCVHIVALATYGFPVVMKDLKVIVKSYLEKLGRSVPIFKSNTPGNDWVALFLKRHAVISHRIAKNISLSRASVNKQAIEEFFSNLEKELEFGERVPPCNIYNFDETNFIDDPGNTKMLVKRGTKYPETIRNATKACTTVMMCGNAAGELLPPYVIYKAENVYNTWTEGGPPHCRYHRSKSGWIDSFIFADWFQHHFLPEVRKKPGKKVIMGDNLSSHFNYEVLTMCTENNISFVALAPNATHLLQPLDVAFFRPLKGQWRKVLTEWKKSPLGRRCGTIPKDQFPKLLKSVMDDLQDRIPGNLKSRFRKCGIYPLNPHVVLNRLCDSMLEQQPTYRDALSSSFVEHLNIVRSESVARKQRKKKLMIPPGKGITADNLQDAAVTSANKRKSNATKSSGVNKGRNKAVRRASNDTKSSGSESVFDVPYAESDDSLTLFNFSGKEDTPLPIKFCNIQQQQPSSSKEPCEETSRPLSMNNYPTLPTLEKKSLFEGDYVIVIYSGSRYPGKVIKEDAGEYEVTCMARAGKWWTWPKEEDRLWFRPRCIVSRMHESTPVDGGNMLFAVDMKR